MIAGERGRTATRHVMGAKHTSSHAYSQQYRVLVLNLKISFLDLKIQILHDLLIFAFRSFV